MKVPVLAAARYSGDHALLQSMRGDALTASALEAARPPAEQSEIRLELLASCVRVDARLVPAVHHAVQRVQQRLNISYETEVYVFDSPSVNAWVTEGRDRFFVGVSSAAVNLLGEPELEFVLGHELGHSFYRHTDVATKSIVEKLPDPRRRMQLMAWSRAAEVSADRAGLVACGDLKVAARAMFQVLSGLRLEEIEFRVADFAEQWDVLENEVADVGTSRHWQLTHPFPHLRMKAMMLFWDAIGENGWEKRASKVLGRVDDDVDRLLAVMDPLGRENPEVADPILEEFFLWGGLYIALTHGRLSAGERERLASVTSRERLDEALRGGELTAKACLQNFRAALSRRRRKLSAGEIFRIMEGLAEIARCDADFADAEQEALRSIAAVLGVNADLMIARRLA